MKFKLVLFSAFFYWLIPVFILFSAGIASAKDFDDGKAIHIEYPDWFNDSPFYDLADVVSESGSNGKKGLMVLFTTQGCSYCSAFIEKSLGDPGIAKLVQENFDSVGMEIFDDVGMVDPAGSSMSIKQFAKLEGAEYSPTLLFFDNTGKRVLRVIGYQNPQRFRVILDYIIGNHYQDQSLRDYYQGITESSPVSSAYRHLKDDPLFTRPPYNLDSSRSPASQPLLVVFEKTGCAECADFHKDVLVLSEIRELLGKFQVVRLDADDGNTIIKLPDGSESTPASWFRETNFTRVPALIFFDEKGSNVLETDALVRRQRMMNSVNFVLERAYDKDWTYQRFARSKGIEKSLKKMKEEKQ